MRRYLIGAALAGFTAAAAMAAPQLYNMVDGSPLDLSLAKEEGSDTKAVQEFLDTGVNIYNEDADVLDEGKALFASACSGCHGHYGEGKLGPALNDDYWTYPRNAEDAGLFSSLFGGLSGQMGPMWGSLTLDEMLKVMAWTRHLYTGDPENASWLTEEQREAFTPFESGKSGDRSS